MGVIRSVRSCSGAARPPRWCSTRPGVQAGDEAAVTIELDEAPREVEVPVDLAAALAADPQAAASFEQMAFTHRKEYARWIAEAKRDETRQRRVAQAVEMIKAGKSRS